ncbi:MAG TPA: DUF3551 domain-containing protein [Bradyrhizobium sp.]|nr:DUF3551 domain-containing protein [Bradyrhizobium sp.]
MFAILTVLAAGTASVTGSAPAAAYDYPYCLQGRQTGYPGDCSYQTYAACMATASGLLAYCGINPRVAFGVQPRRAPRYYPY